MRFIDFIQCNCPESSHDERWMRSGVLATVMEQYTPIEGGTRASRKMMEKKKEVELSVRY